MPRYCNPDACSDIDIDTCSIFIPASKPVLTPVPIPLCRYLSQRQDPSGNDRAARVAAGGLEWSSFEAFLTLMLAAAPFLAASLLTSTAVYIPELGPAVQVTYL